MRKYTIVNLQMRPAALAVSPVRIESRDTCRYRVQAGIAERHSKVLARRMGDGLKIKAYNAVVVLLHSYDQENDQRSLSLTL